MESKNKNDFKALGLGELAGHQLEIPIVRKPEVDRNYHLGGRSFYFFDFDDNVAFLTTPLILFHKTTGTELTISSGEYALAHSEIGKSGIYQDYEIRFDDREGTFRCFRDHDDAHLSKLGFSKQTFIHDLSFALKNSDFVWKGPSWSCFYHAVFNQRPVSLITARGHESDTIKQGIKMFVDKGHLPLEPNYLSVYAVSNPKTQKELSGTSSLVSVSELKQKAIRASVEKAFQIYGYSPHHRFGMSDDDPKNIQLITEELVRLKKDYKEVKFFMIETAKGEFLKKEITADGPVGSDRSDVAGHQIRMF